VSTGIKVKKGNQGIDREALKKSEKLKLSRTEDAVTKYIESSQRLEQPILKAEMEAVVKKALGKNTTAKGSFTDDYLQMLKDMETGALLNPKHNTRFSPDTIANYKSTLSYLQKFASDTGTALIYNIDESWVREFIVWLTKPKMVEKRLRNGNVKKFPNNGYSKNSIAVTIGNLKGFLSHMYRAKKHTSLFYKHDVFLMSREEADAEALDIEEIKKLYELPLKGARERARDVFVFGCWVALRSDDLQRINEYKLRGKFFEVLTSKTGAKVIIPVHPMAKAIYEKYNGEMPIFKNNNNLNRHIAALCKDAGITEECMITITRGGKKVAEYYPKCDLISIHSARRSFATNAVLAGIPDRRIMKITGHETESSFRKYVRIKKQENAESLAEHPFFKGAMETGK
jgi:site-specific recombinase XerD